MGDRIPPPTETLVRRLFELACTPFKLDAWRNRWREYGWSHDRWDSDEYGFRVVLPEGWVLMVDPVGGDLVGASLPFYYWEDAEDDARQKQAFDRSFETTSELASRVLSEPILRLADADSDGHRAVAWAGSHGILILQQACFDPQFGIEVDFWLTNCSKDEFCPNTPLIDWLVQRSQRIHDERGFPPLQG